MAFDIAGARRAGYSDDEIADFLGSKSSFDVAGARKAGYGTNEIMAHLSSEWARQPLPEGVAPSDAGAGRGRMVPSLPDGPPAQQQAAVPQSPQGRGVGGVLADIRENEALRSARMRPAVSVLEQPAPRPSQAQGLTEQEMTEGSVAPWRLEQLRTQQNYGDTSRSPVAKPFDTAQNIAQDVRELTRNPVARGGVAGFATLGKVGTGAVRMVADMVGADSVSDFARGASRASSTIGDGMLQGLGGNEKLIAQVTTSIVNSAPSVALGVVGGPALRTLFTQSTLAEYNEGRDAGFDPAESAARAGIMGMAEALGERFGFPEQIKVLRGLARGMPSGDLAKAAGALLLKEIPGEQATTLMQFLADKFGPAALRPGASMGDYLEAAGETLKVTIGQTAVMGGGPAAIATTRDAVRGADRAIERSAMTLPERAAADIAKPAMRPTEMRRMAADRFDDFAATHGIPEPAVKAAKQAAERVPLKQLPGFFKRAAAALSKRGLVGGQVDDAALGALDEPAPPAVPQTTQPPADATDYSGLDTLDAGAILGELGIQPNGAADERVPLAAGPGPAGSVDAGGSDAGRGGSPDGRPAAQPTAAVPEGVATGAAAAVDAGVAGGPDGQALKESNDAPTAQARPRYSGRTDSRVPRMASDERSLPSSGQQGIQGVRSQGGDGGATVGEQLPAVPAGRGAVSKQQALAGSDREQQGVRAWQRPVGDIAGAEPQSPQQRSPDPQREVDADGGMVRGNGNPKQRSASSTGKGLDDGAGAGNPSGRAPGATDARGRDALYTGVVGAERRTGENAAQAGSGRLDDGARTGEVAADVAGQPIDEEKETAIERRNRLVAEVATASGQYRDGGKWSATYRTLQRSDGSFVLARNLADDNGARTEHLSMDGTWAKGEPAQTAVSGFTQLSGPESFPSEQAALQHAIETEGAQAQSAEAADGATEATNAAAPAGDGTTHPAADEVAPGVAAPEPAPAARPAGKLVETWTGTQKKGMLIHAARAQMADQKKRRPDLDWTVVPAPEFAEDRFKLEGRERAPEFTAGDRITIDGQPATVEKVAKAHIVAKTDEGKKRTIAFDSPTMEKIRAARKAAPVTAAPKADPAPAVEQQLEVGAEEAMPMLSRSDTPSQAQRSQDDVARYGRLVDAFAAGQRTFSRAPLNLGRTPDVLRMLDAPDLPLSILPETIFKAMRQDDGSGATAHGLSAEVMRALPQALNDPVMVFSSKTQPGALVVLTELFDSQGKPVIAAIHLRREQGRVMVNRIASAYGRNLNQIRAAVNDGDAVYVHNEKAPEWATTVGLQLPWVVQPASGAKWNFKTEADLAQVRSDPAGGLPLFSRSDATRQAYEQRIDELYAGEAPKRIGVRVLDGSDMLDLLGHGRQPMHLVESKVESGRFNHHLTAEHWKRVPEWLENPVAVFDSETMPGRLVFVAPETVNGDPVLLIVHPGQRLADATVDMLVNAYDRSGNKIPVQRWLKADLLRYLDETRSPSFGGPSGLQLPRVNRPAKGSTKNVLTDRDLVKLRSALSRGTGRGVTMGDADAAVALIRDAMPKAPQIVVFDDVRKAPAELVRLIKAVGAEHDVEAAYHAGKVYVFPQHIESIERLMFVVGRHELRHYGFDAMLGPRRGQVMLGIGMKNPALMERAKAIQAEGKTTNLTRAIEEALADMPVAEVAKLSGFGRLVSLIRQWLRNMAAALREKGLTSIADAIEPKTWTDEDVAAFVLKAENVSRSGARGSATGEAMLSRHTPEQKQALARAGIGGKRTFATRVGDAFSGAVDALSWSAFRQGALDQFHGIDRAVRREVGNLPIEQDPYITARLANGGTSSVMRALLLHGQAKWAANGQHLEKIDGTKGLLDILAPLGDNLTDWFGWMVGNRAARLMKEGRENNFTAADIAALQSLAGSRLGEFQKAAIQYTAFKRSVLDVAQGAGLIDAEARKSWDHADYIPFYRQIDEKATFSATGRKGLAGQSSGIRVLRGGESALNDPLENLLMNFSRLIDASLKNNALLKTVDTLTQAGSDVVAKVGYDMKGVVVPRAQVRKMLEDAGTAPQVLDVIPPEAFDGMAKLWAIQAPSDPDVIRVMRGGKPQFYRVNDPLLLKAATSFVPFDFPGLGAARAFKRVLTATVTATPEFMARNFIRDSLAAPMIGRDGVNPAKSLVGIVKSYTESGGAEAMLFAGASFQSGHINAADPTGTAVSLRRALRQKGLDASAVDSFMGSIIDFGAKGWEHYRKVGEAVENANREAIYEAALRKGKSVTSAVYEAKDLMDFNLRGSSAGYQILADVLPFFNARVQGLYRAGRADPKRLVAYGTLLMLASLALAADNWDREEYEQLPDWDKDAYWHVWIGGEHFRIPKPFELGVAFATIPERIMRYISDRDTGTKFAKRLWANVRDQLAFDPMPQIARPAVDAYYNHASFQDRPIEGMADQGKLPHMRYSATTSDTAKVLLKATAPVTDKIDLSPKKLEYLVGGYLGTVGLYALGLSDIAVREIMDAPARPKLRPDDMPFVKAFYRLEPARATVYESDLYQMREEIEKVYRSVNAHIKAGDADEARKLVAEHRQELALRGPVNDAAAMMSDVNKARDRIYADRKMTPEEKRAKIDRLQAQKNEVARKTMTHPKVKEAQ